MGMKIIRITKPVILFMTYLMFVRFDNVSPLINTVTFIPISSSYRYVLAAFRWGCF